tara:strand:- start:422 stop:796 length:375 start_codon:yes stop_codon:yes gene_type:complete
MLGFLTDKVLLTDALYSRCPKCHVGDLFKPGWNMEVNETCPHCHIELAKHNDSADGPAVFLIFVLGFLLVPLALLLEVIASPPLWAHGVLWTIIALALTLGSLKPLKSYIIGLEYKYRPWDKSS